MSLNNLKLSVFGGKTLNNFKTDIMKSGLQKYIRRGELDKALYCLVELDMFKKLDDKKVKGLRSNVRNRLIVILSEDIGISNWNIYLKINNLLKKWEELRKEDNDNDRYYLVNIVNYLAKSKKVRLCSHIRTYFYYCINNEDFNKYYENKNKIFEKEDKCGINFYKKNDCDEVKECIDGIVYNLKNNNDNLFYWFFRLINNKKWKSGRRNRRAKKEYIIFDIINNFIKKIKNNNLIMLYDILYNWFINYNNSRNENILYLMNIVLFYIKRNEINWDKKLNIKEIDNIEKIYKRNFEYKLEIDNYIIDMHCEDGRKNGKNEKDFMENGSKINNKSKYEIELYKKIYDEYKLYKLKTKVKKIKVKKVKVKKVKVKKLWDLEEELDFIDFKELMGIENEKDLDKYLSRENTCGGKVMTFVNKDKGIVVKEMRKSFNYGRDCCVIDEIKKYFGIKKMNVRRIKSNICVSKINKKNKYWKNNMKLENKETIYLIMDIFENIGTLVENKKKRVKKEIKLEYLKILLFRGLLRVSDSNYTNVLINEKDELLSIDENNIGKREKYIERKISKCYNKDDINKVVDKILENKDYKIKKIKKKLKKYKMEEYCKLVEERFENLRETIFKEFEYFNKLL